VWEPRARNRNPSTRNRRHAVSESDGGIASQRERFNGLRSVFNRTN